MKKTLRKILSIVLAVVMLFSFATVAYAVDGVAPCAGRETWYKGGGKVGSFTLSSTNLTPIKTMGDSGELWVYGTVEANNNGNPWWIVVQIKDAYSGEVLAETTSTPRGNSEQAYSVPLNVTKGQQIRVYLYYGSMPANYAYVGIYYLLD